MVCNLIDTFAGTFWVSPKGFIVCKIRNSIGSLLNHEYYNPVSNMKNEPHSTHFAKETRGWASSSSKNK